MKHHDQRNQKRKGLICLTLPLKEVGEDLKQGEILEEGADAEAMEE